jgi:hypothetical protein
MKHGLDTNVTDAFHSVSPELHAHFANRRLRHSILNGCQFDLCLNQTNPKNKLDERTENALSARYASWRCFG